MSDDLLLYMATVAAERQLKHKTMIVDFFPPLEKFPDERIYLGVMSWTLPDRHERWIKPSAVINIGNGLQTAGEIARDYLDFKFPNRLRATGAQAALLKMHRSAPLYCEPSVLEDATYVDLKSAFWSIMMLLGWNVDYYPSKWIVKGKAPDDYPLSEHKQARNSLVTCGLSTPLRMWTGKKVTRQFARNNHINMGLWAIIMDTLHAIAAYARQLDAVYIHTDGYILPSEKAKDLLTIIREFGLYASVKASGISTVIGMGNWKVGNKATKFYGRHTSYHGGVEHIYQVNIDQIRAKLKKCETNNMVRMARQYGATMREL